MSFLDDFGFRPMRIGIAIIVIIMAGTAYTTWRNARMDALAHSAVDKKPDPTAVKRLAGYSGQRASDLLLVVSTPSTTPVFHKVLGTGLFQNPLVVSGNQLYTSANNTKS